MNVQRRGKIREAQELISQARSIIEDVRADEESAYENMPDGLQSSDAGEKMSANVELLVDVETDLESVDSNLTEVME